MPVPLLPEPLRLLTTQADLQDHAAPGRGIFNPPSATGTGFWSINPYVGCAFGCAYCYARDTHRYVMERAGEVGRHVSGSLPPWLAFERRVLVKEHAGDAAGTGEGGGGGRSPQSGGVRLAAAVSLAPAVSARGAGAVPRVGVALRVHVSLQYS